MPCSGAKGADFSFQLQSLGCDASGQMREEKAPALLSVEGVEPRDELAEGAPPVRPAQLFESPLGLFTQARCFSGNPGPGMYLQLSGDLILVSCQDTSNRGARCGPDRSGAGLALLVRKGVGRDSRQPGSQGLGKP